MTDNESRAQIYFPHPQSPLFSNLFHRPFPLIPYPLTALPRSLLFSLLNYSPKMLRVWSGGLAGSARLHYAFKNTASVPVNMQTDTGLHYSPQTQTGNHCHTHTHTWNNRDNVNKIKNKNVKQLKAAQQNTTEYTT